MKVFRSALREVGAEFRAPPTIAPLDVGDDAAAIARRALDAAVRAHRVDLHVRTRAGSWTWRGCLGSSTWQRDVLCLKGERMLVKVDTTRIFAVSMIANHVSGGLRMFANGGSSLALWTDETGLFDAWIASLTSD